MLQQPGQNKSASGSIPDTLATFEFYRKAQHNHAMEMHYTTPNQLNVPRGSSPFCANSPFHPTKTQQGAVLALETISPKDTVLNYPKPADGTSLFAHEQSYGNSSQEVTNDRSYDLGSSQRGGEAEILNSIGAPSYRQHSLQIPMLSTSLSPSHYPSLETSPMTTPVGRDQSYPISPSPIIKPEGSKAGTGAYTCTVQGCQQRFNSIVKLQTHKKQNHHHSASVGSTGMTSTLRGNLSSRHQGPYRCTLIKPRSGKPSDTTFTRFHDFTRQRDTIHNAAREKTPCEVCNDGTTFSRQDSFTRHKKVKPHSIKLIL